MDKFRESVERRKILCLVVIAIGVALIVYNNIISPRNMEGTYDHGVVEGFIYGIMISFELLSCILLQKYRKALADDKALRMLYNEENDERKKLIRSKAGMPVIAIDSIALIIAAVIASKFNILVFKVLIIVALIQVSFSVIIKFYYLRKL